MSLNKYILPIVASVLLAATTPHLVQLSATAEKNVAHSAATHRCRTYSQNTSPTDLMQRYRQRISTYSADLA